MKSSINITKGRNTLTEAFAKSIANIESQVEIRKLHIVEELLQFLKREGINRSELTQPMGVPPSRITGASMLYGVGREMISHITARSPDGILTLPSVSLSKTHRNLNRRKRQQRRKVTENDGGRGSH